MANAPSEVDEVIRELKTNHGFKQFAAIQNEGIVIKWEGMEYLKAVQVAYLVLDLCSKSKKYIRELFDPPDNDVESLRLKTVEYEMIVAQHGNYTLVVVQDTEERPEEEGEEDEEGEGKKEE